MIKWLASVASCHEETGQALIDAWTRGSGRSPNKAIGDCHGSEVRLGIETVDPLLQLPLVRSVMNCVDGSAVDRGATLVWTFSSVAVTIGTLRTLLDAWDETGQPPVLSIVGLELGDHRHDIIGVEAFAGHKLSAEFVDPARSRDAARNLARLARHAVVNGALDRRAVYEGVESRVLSLRWPPDAGSPDMVTIVL
jgi:hypothetical protein